MNLKNLEKKKDEEIQAKKTEINNMAIEKKKLIAEFEETKKLTAGMKESVRKADIFTFIFGDYPLTLLPTQKFKTWFSISKF